MSVRSCIALLALVLSVASIAVAQDPATQSFSAPIDLAPPPAPDSVDQDLADAAARPAGILRYGPVSLMDPALKSLNAELDQFGLKIGFAYTAVYQAATGGPGHRDAGGGDADLFG